MKNTFLLFLVGIASLLYSQVSACDCAPSPDNFCQSIRYNEHVALVKVVSKQGSFMNVEILESIRNTFSTSTITVIGQDGLNCSEWLETFEVSDTLVLGLGDFGLTDTFNLSLCGRYYLFYENGNVTGNITPSISLQPYTDFRDNFGECATLASIKETENQLIELFMLNETVKINSKKGNIQLAEIIGADGRLILQETADQPSIQLNVSNMKPSVYFFRVITSEGESIRKLLIP